MKVLFHSLLVLLAVVTQVGTQQGDEPLFPVQHEGGTTYIDRKGNEVFTVRYAGARFSEGLARVTLDTGMGYIDRTGKLVIGPISYGARDFSNGLAMVESAERCTTETKQKYGYIDRNGTFIIPATLTRPCNAWGDEFYFTKEGLALTNIDDKWGFIDRTGKLVMQFDAAGQFSEGLAPVKVNGKFGYIDPKGKVVIEPAFDQAFSFAEGLAAVRSKDLWGFIDTRGKFIIEPQYTEVQSFSEGLATVQVNQPTYGWATIDRTGKIVIPPSPNGRTRFSNGLSRVRIDHEEGFIDKTGKMVIKPYFVRAEDFRDGLAYVMDSETAEKSYIDTTGTVVYKFPVRKGPPPNPNDPFVKISNATDVQWLERIVSSPAAAEELRPVRGSTKGFRLAAYVRLGVLGTPESIAAIERIETEARKIRVAPAQSTAGDFTHAAVHFGDSPLRPLAQVTNANGLTYAIIVSALMGDLDLFLISTRTPKDASSWSRPLLIPNKVYRGVKEPQLTLEGAGELLFSFVQEPPPGRHIMEGTGDPGPTAPAMGRQQWKLSIKQIETDSDADGWTDVEEQRLGIDPNNKDSDGDGIEDGQDVCPNFSLSFEDKNDDEFRIVKRAFFATFGLGGSRQLLLIDSRMKRVHMWGYAGPVIYGQDLKRWSDNHQFGFVFVSWQIHKLRNENEIAVGITDYEGALAASGHEVKLRKINGEWFVISSRMTWIA
jgi:hypothetical protein